MQWSCADLTAPRVADRDCRWPIGAAGTYA
jgi:hypothetical protein